MIVSCCNIMSHSFSWKSLSMLHSPDMKGFLKFCIALSALFALWLLGGTNWYVMFIEVIVIFKAADASLSIKWKPVLITHIFKSYVKSVKARIISLSLIFFIYVVMIVLKSYTYELQSTINVQVLGGFAVISCARRSNKAQTNQAKITGVKYFCAYQQVVSTSSFILYPIFILLPHYLQQLTFWPRPSPPREYAPPPDLGIHKKE